MYAHLSVSFIVLCFLFESYKFIFDIFGLNPKIDSLFLIYFI